MKLFEPNMGALQVARDVLLTPFGLDESKLLKALGNMFTHKVDYADLYFQFTKSEGWSLEEGIVKTGSFSIDQGVGVRAVSGDKTAFSYSDDISKRPCWTPPPPPAPSPARAWQDQGGRAMTRGGRALYLPHDPLPRWTPPPRCSCWSASNAWPAPRTRASSRSWPAWPANTTWCWWRAATACWRPISARWCACRSP
jgi:hypothetical protein